MILVTRNLYVKVGWIIWQWRWC